MYDDVQRCTGSEDRPTGGYRSVLMHPFLNPVQKTGSESTQVHRARSLEYHSRARAGIFRRAQNGFKRRSDVARAGRKCKVPEGRKRGRTRPPTASGPRRARRGSCRTMPLMSDKTERGCRTVPTVYGRKTAPIEGLSKTVSRMCTCGLHPPSDVTKPGQVTWFSDRHTCVKTAPAGHAIACIRIRWRAPA